VADTKRGEGIYDPLLGNGTTLATAELTGRVCSGLEIDPKYIDVAILRWQQQAGRKATLEGDGRSFEQVAQERQGVAI
jgi:DNA modification methylase